MLKKTFISLLTNYTDNHALVDELWSEMGISYSSPGRHYHTLEHLDNLLFQLIEVKENIQGWNTILFSLYYHDIVYDPLKSDNEEQSAVLAQNRMLQAAVPHDVIERCSNHILATKAHFISPDCDTNYFTDADLSVLGQPWAIYLTYCKNVRKEYAIYPDAVYNPGRKKVLNHFLKMERIFKMDYFHQRFEASSRQNLQREIELLE